MELAQLFLTVGLALLTKLVLSPAVPVNTLFKDTIKSGNFESEKTHGASSLLPFLKRFGYIRGETNVSQSDQESETLYTEESVALAIKQMQKFGALPQTGMLNDDTLALLTKPRCGIPDVIRPESREHERQKRFVIGSKGWNKRRINYRVDNWAPQLSESTVRAEVRKAFGVWADYARLRFVEKPRLDRDDVDISIQFGQGYHGDGYPFDGNGGVLAHAFFPYSHGSLAGDIHFDLDENWKSAKTNGSHSAEAFSPVSFLSVAIHEIGHSLGLSHSPSRDSVMFPYYQGFEQTNDADAKLGYDDIMAMYQLYIQREIEDFPDDDIRTNPTSPSSSTTTERVTHPATEVTRRHTTYSSSTSSYGLTTESNEESVPDLCRDGFDTVSFIRSEIFVFKNKYMWRYQNRGVRVPPYPVLTARLFPMLAEVDHIDAAFENENGKIFFFSGNQFWVYSDNSRNRGVEGPFRITKFGLPNDLEKVDAAFIWGKNNKLYFFSGSLFWRYNGETEKMDEGYPKVIEKWKGLPTDGVNAAFKWSDVAAYSGNLMIKMCEQNTGIH